MENEITNVQAVQRDIETVTLEINGLREHAEKTFFICAVEIGRRLIEAKDLLPHGEWAEWLSNEVAFSQSTANKYMQLFNKFGSAQLSIFGAELKSETFTNLSYSQALKLLAVPDDEVEEFVKKNDVENMSARELDKLIKERDEARAKAEQAAELEKALEDAKQKAEESRILAEKADKTAEGLKISVEDLQAKLEKSKASTKKYKELAKNPEIPPEKLEELRKEAERIAEESKSKEIEAAIENIKASLAAAEEEKQKAIAESQRQSLEIEELKKKMLMSDPAVTEFKTQFNSVQEDMRKLTVFFNNINDDGLKDKFRAAVKAMLDKQMEEYK